MANPTINIAVILSAVDKMSSVFRTASTNAIAEMERMKKAGKDEMLKGAGMAATGAGLIAAIKPSVDAFAELEEATVRLETRLMDKNGIANPNLMKGLADQAILLGNKLPGSTADMTNMFTTMIENGVDAERIIGGLGKATAYFAANNKMAYDEGAQFVARLALKLNIADKDAMKFLDTINRTKQTGVDMQELGISIGRMGGSLKILGMDGLKGFEKMAPIVGYMVKKLGGESGGTALNTLFLEMSNTTRIEKANKALSSLGMSVQFFDKKGYFMGFENMMLQFEKVAKLNPAQREGFLKALTGGSGQDVQAMISLMELFKDGAKEYKEALAFSESKATLEDQVQKNIKTLNALIEAAEGTWTNTLAAIGETFAPELKAMTEMFRQLSENIQKFTKEHPKIIKFIATFTAMLGVVLLVGGAVVALKGAMMLLAAVSLATPIGWVLALIAALAALYVHFSDTEHGWSYMWENMAHDAAGWVSMIQNLLEPIVATLRFIFLDRSFSGFSKIAEAWNNIDLNKAYAVGFNRSKEEQFNRENPIGGTQPGQYVMTYSPTFTIQGNASMSDIKEVNNQSQKKFAEFMIDWERNKKRKEF